MLDNIEQNSDEWLELKAGKFSASRAKDLMAKGQGGAPSKTRANLIASLAVERMTGKYSEGFKSWEMERGNEVEDEAADAYTFLRGVVLEKVAFVPHPKIKNCGASPDRLVGDDGLAEFKCPSASARHGDALLRGSHGVEHNKQAQFQMMCTGRKWVDVVSYCPSFPEGLELAIVRLERDEKMIGLMEQEIEKAEVEVLEMMEKFKAIQAKGIK